MSERLPTGTVSFLFTDVEGSTGLARRFGTDFASLISRHFSILTEAIGRNEGTIVKTTGDGVFAAFTSARSALAAAVAIEQAITNTSWPSGGEVKVRVGVHTGEAEIVDDDYAGIDVHRAARVMAAGHGGQVLVTEATRMLAGEAFELKALGRHLLRGLEGDEMLYQVSIAGLPSEFPPLRTAAAAPNNLPSRLTPMIGRADDVDALSRLVGEHRLVTVLGPGGVGKTTLALSTAAGLVESFTDGVVFVDLSSVTDPDLVIPEIASSMEVEPGTIDGLVGRMEDASCLIVLDNFEQVLPAAAGVGQILQRTNRLRALVTSQAPLRVAGEHRYLLEPLDPEGGEGVELFVERARAVAPWFDTDDEAIREVVRYLNGLPLALELVAARANVLQPAEMLSRLHEDHLTGAAPTGAPTRHRSVEDAIGWSYDLLDDSTGQVFRQLGVFTGAISVNAAEEVAGGDGSGALFDDLAELVDRSLLRRLPGSSGRFKMLDGIRRFARRLLDASEERREVESRYVDHYIRLCRDAYSGLQDDKGEWWRAHLAEELENLREVVALLHRAGRRDEGLELLGNIWRFHQSRGYLHELDLSLRRLFLLPDDASNGVGAIKGLMARAAVDYWRRDSDQAISGYREAVQLARARSDRHLLAEALYGLGTSLIIDREIDEAHTTLDMAREIYADVGDQGGLADVIAAEAFADLAVSGLVGLGPKFEEATELYDSVGRNIQGTQTVYAQGAVALVEGRLDEARSFSVDGIRRGLDLGDEFLQVWGVEYVSRIAAEAGDVETAGILAGAAGANRESMGGGWSPAAVGIEDTAEKLARELGPERAEQLLVPGRGLAIPEAVRIAMEWQM